LFTWVNDPSQPTGDLLEQLMDLVGEEEEALARLL
jgi:hypothetical protein